MSPPSAWVWPVSYTHLDVYKRQAQYNALESVPVEKKSKRKTKTVELKEYVPALELHEAGEWVQMCIRDRDKAEQLGLSGKLLLLRQDLLKLDLYGTIRGAVSTFDTFNHIPDLDTAIANAGFFMEKGGVFLFDMNTPYKHKNVLGENTFTFEEDVYKRQSPTARSLTRPSALWAWRTANMCLSLIHI